MDIHRKNQTTVEDTTRELANNEASLFLHHKNQTTVEDTTRKLVSDEALLYIEIALFVVVSGTVGIFGVLANVANIAVFVKQGVQESSNISLLCLSVADLMLCVATVGTAAVSALDKAHLKLNVDFPGVYYVFATIRQCFSDLSMFTIVFLSLERCLCVVKPLTCKHIITRRRTIIILNIIYTEAIVFHILLLSEFRLLWLFDETTNSTCLQLYILPIGKSMNSIYSIVNGVGLSSAAIILVTAASLFMTIKLRKAFKFRMSNSFIEAERRSGQVTLALQLSTKDLRVVKMVAYVSVMFVVGYLPFTILSLIQIFIPDVDYMKPQHNLNETFWGIIYASVTINSASNILVYLRVSSKYRTIFLNTFCGRFRS